MDKKRPEEITGKEHNIMSVVRCSRTNRDKLIAVESHIPEYQALNLYLPKDVVPV